MKKSYNTLLYYTILKNDGGFNEFIKEYKKE